jgi:hypothetical protein
MRFSLLDTESRAPGATAVSHRQRGRYAYECLPVKIASQLLGYELQVVFALAEASWV